MTNGEKLMQEFPDFIYEREWWDAEFQEKDTETKEPEENGS